MNLTKNNTQAGFTLLELLIALVVFAVGILGVYSMQMVSITGNSKSRIVSEGSTMGAGFLETIISWDYDHQALVDDDDSADASDSDGDIDSGDGTGKDLNYDGIDDTGGDFGLTDKVNPDGLVTEDGYTIYWNVANDIPLPNTKTIRVIVDAPHDVNDISIAFIKYKN